jgi:hypothetical protein
MQRCIYCGRALYKNKSGKYYLCSSKCRSKFKNKKNITEIEKAVSVMINGILVNYVVGKLEYEKFDIACAIRRLIYKNKNIFIKTNDEINLKVSLFIKKKLILYQTLTMNIGQ